MAESPQYPQAFRLGTVVGVQTHPEATPAIVRSWLRSPGGREMLSEAGVDGDEILAAVAAAEQASRAMAARFFGAWIDEALRADAR
jgi:GMP synthase-like glutamine amidotransferase